MFSTKTWLVIIAAIAANAVIFGTGAIIVLSVPALAVNAKWLIPAVVAVSLALAPLVGWTEDGYRLGYGGGYFDRTLAALKPRPFVIGIGFDEARLSTIYPQPHDIRLDMILTEAGVRAQRDIA